MNPPVLLNEPLPHIARPKPEPAHYGYIDAGRGLAILGVFLVHSAMHVPNLPRYFAALCSYGQFGVQLFFVLSALTLLLSFHSRSQEKDTRVRNFAIRRFFRIAPLFWFGILLYNYQGLRPNTFSPNGLTWAQVLATLAFVQGWYPTYINSVIQGGWSIAVETTFYAVFPLLAVWLTTQKQTLLALTAAVVAGSCLNVVLFHQMQPFWQGPRATILFAFLNWWFPSQLPVFLIGFLLYGKVKALKETPFPDPDARRRRALLCVAGAGLIAALLVGDSPLRNLAERAACSTAPLSLGFAAAFALLVYGLALVPFPLLVNRFLRYLGLISFSGYIDHFFVLDKTSAALNMALQRGHVTLAPLAQFALLCALALPATMAAATLTYHAIEKPGMALGKKLIIWLDARRAASAGG